MKAIQKKSGENYWPGSDKMLPDLDLDNERYDDIIENARNMIVSIYPKWTDFNYHDPGVTMLEMFAWLKEIQQYYLNKIGPDSIRNFLKLLGLRQHTKKPSRTEVRIRCGEDLIAGKGTKLYAGGICFEADDRTYVSSAVITCCIIRNGSDIRAYDRKELSFGGGLRICTFPAGASGEFYVGFDKPLQEGEAHRMYFSLRDQGTVARNPITDPESFIHLVDISAEYYDGLIWRPLELRDETFGLITSGNMDILLGKPHAKCRVGGKEAYFIRFSLKGGEYDEVPLIRCIEFGLLPVTQRDTKAEYFDLPASGELKTFSELSVSGSSQVYLRDADGLFTKAPSFEKYIDEITGEVTFAVPGTDKAVSVRIVNISQDFLPDTEIGYGMGLPYQEYDLRDRSLEYESFTLMTELPASGGKYIEWKKVGDFSSAGSEDFVYVFDSAAGIVRFGDCIRGMAPEGRIFIVGCSSTLGAEGNVSASKINRIASLDDTDTVVYNLRRSEGGCSEETTAECFVRAHRLLSTTETVVTDEDCESFISSVQGLKIEKCRVIHMDGRSSNEITAVVRPYSPDGRGVPCERYIDNIMAAFESRRLLGTRLRIIRPEYLAVTVFADVLVSRTESDARETVSRTVSEYFDSLRDRFGTKIVYSRLYELIDRLDCVLNVNMLTLEIDGSSAERTREGDIKLYPNVSAYIDEIKFIISVG